MIASSLVRGHVVLAPFPFSDLSNAKVRPAVIVSSNLNANDVVLMAISSVVRGAMMSTDFVIPSTHPEFSLTGLRVTSVLRGHKIVAVEQSIILRRLGQVGPQLQSEINRLLRQVLQL